jgi:uncharacterized protein YcbK (DUF882 family)
MTEPELEGRGLSSASRRRFIWLGGGIAAGLLLVPDFSFAAKVSNAVKKTATGKDARASKASGAGHVASANSAKSGKAAPASGNSPSKPAGRSTASTSKHPRVASSGKRPGTTSHGGGSSTHRGRDVASTRSHGASRGRDATPARAVADAEELELPPSFGSGSSESRAVSLYCVHTGEELSVDYYVDGRYEPDALRAIDHLLRDYHNDEICQFDPRVLNQLYDVRRALGSNEAFHVYSGYRSPETNESYRRLSNRVAEHSYHLTGQAIDVHLPGRDIRQIRNVAVAMRAGGVGYYPQEGFVHIDSGPVRRW